MDIFTDVYYVACFVANYVCGDFRNIRPMWNVAMLLRHNDLVGPVPARYVRHGQMCPQLDVSDKNDQKTQDMSDKARCVRQKWQTTAGYVRQKNSLYFVGFFLKKRRLYPCAYIKHMHARYFHQVTCSWRHVWHNFHVYCIMSCIKWM